MRRWIAAFLSALLAVAAFPAAGTAAAEAASEPKLAMLLDGRPLSPDKPPRIVDGRTLVPIRLVSESLGATVDWTPNDRRIDIRRGARKIDLQVGRRWAVVDGVSRELDVPPLILDQSTYVPIRFVAETFGLTVGWDGQAYSVFLWSPRNSSPSPGSGGKSDPSNDPSNGGPTPMPTSSGTPSPSPTPSASPPSDRFGSGPESRSACPPPFGAVPTPSPAPGPAATPPLSSSAPADPAGAVDPVGAVVADIRLYGDCLMIGWLGSPPSADAQVFYLKNPDRAVIDLPGARLAASLVSGMTGGEGTVASASAYVARIRYAQHPDKVRLVLDVRPGVRLSRRQTPVEWPNYSFYEVGVPRYAVVIDPGHGGTDPGATSGKYRIFEKDFTLSLAKKVYDRLAVEPLIRPVMTRTDDTYPTLEERVALANGLNADLFVSIHGNKYNGVTHGTETYYFHEWSLSFAQEVHRRVLAATGFADRGVRQKAFYVVRETVMPSVLLEVGYLDHPANEEQLLKDDFQARVAEAIADAVKSALGIGPEGT